MSVKRWEFWAATDEHGLQEWTGAPSRDFESGPYVLAADYDALREAVQWVVNDAAYKAPEQVTAGLAAIWLRRLNAALKASEEATGDSLARSGPGAKA